VAGGAGCDDTARAAGAAARVAGVSGVTLAADPALEHGLAEPMAALLAGQAAAMGVSHVITASSSTGRDVLPRAAGLAGREPVTDVVAAHPDGRTFVRPIYAGNARATVAYAEGDGGTRYVSVRPAAFPGAADRPAGEAAAAVEPVDEGALAAARSATAATWMSDEGSSTASSRPDLGAAPVVVAGGRALGGPDGFTALARLADRLGGALGASRAAVDAGWVANDLQVGQTGRVVAPGLYIAAGISGAIQHLAGMKDSKCIVAINTDADAPIFQVRVVVFFLERRERWEREKKLRRPLTQPTRARPKKQKQKKRSRTTAWSPTSSKPCPSWRRPSTRRAWSKPKSSGGHAAAALAQAGGWGPAARA
jgi:electron transfer flavoprotein alpha subunit